MAIDAYVCQTCAQTVPQDSRAAHEAAHTHVEIRPDDIGIDEGRSYE